MIIRKITHGFVIQTWDTENKEWTGQEFVAGDDVEYECDGLSIDLQTAPLDEYFPFHMVQPKMNIFLLWEQTNYGNPVLVDIFQEYSDIIEAKRKHRRLYPLARTDIEVKRLK